MVWYASGTAEGFATSLQDPAPGLSTHARRLSILSRQDLQTPNPATMPTGGFIGDDSSSPNATYMHRLGSLRYVNGQSFTRRAGGGRQPGCNSAAGSLPCSKETPQCGITSVAFWRDYHSLLHGKARPLVIQRFTTCSLALYEKKRYPLLCSVS
ncbi:hypothetical protein BX600DRAFT_261010 [Xylariales sp. PMI_506]|nr:hypothetical protein BX600DRAFT_261010 [Xylariales sp. PMI_506]